jgi:uncharacterized protein (TIGR02453 family)
MDFIKTFNFLNDLALNNNRDWFNQHKDKYLIVKDEFDEFINKLIPKIREFDSEIGHITSKDCVFRIYRDVRFSSNKDPYKTHFGAYISNGGRKTTYAGYYIHIQPGQSFLAAGAYLPTPEILKEIRYEIIDNSNDFLNIIENKNFIKYFSGLAGEKGKLVPKGFPKEHPYIELIKYKSYEIIHNLKDEEILSVDFEQKILNVVQAAVPLNKFLNKIIKHTLAEE